MDFQPATTKAPIGSPALSGQVLSEKLDLVDLSYSLIRPDIFSLFCRQPRRLQMLVPTETT